MNAIRSVDLLQLYARLNVVLDFLRGRIDPEAKRAYAEVLNIQSSLLLYGRKIASGEERKKSRYENG